MQRGREGRIQTEILSEGRDGERERVRERDRERQRQGRGSEAEHR